MKIGPLKLSSLRSRNKTKGTEQSLKDLGKSSKPTVERAVWHAAPHRMMGLKRWGRARSDSSMP